MSTEKEKNELKSQGAIEAAQDPNSSVTADDASRTIVEESKKAGAAALRFDPDASPEEKAAQARAVSKRPGRRRKLIAHVSLAGQQYTPPTKGRRRCHGYRE